jgi:hypothetical protein
MSRTRLNKTRPQLERERSPRVRLLPQVQLDLLEHAPLVRELTPHRRLLLWQRHHIQIRVVLPLTVAIHRLDDVLARVLHLAPLDLQPVRAVAVLLHERE